MLSVTKGAPETPVARKIQRRHSMVDLCPGKPRRTSAAGSKSTVSTPSTCSPTSSLDSPFSRQLSSESGGSSPGSVHSAEGSQGAAEAVSPWSRVKSRLRTAVDLSRQEQNEEALQALDKAMRGEDQLFLLEAIRQARSTGVSKSKLMEADRLVQQLEAQKELRSAVEAKACAGLKLALQHAQIAGVDSTAIRQAERIYKRLESVEQLSAALAVGESSGIKVCLQVAMHAGVDDEELLQEAKRMLQSFEQKRRSSIASKASGASEMDCESSAKNVQSKNDMVSDKIKECLDNLNYAIQERETGGLKMAIQLAAPFVQANVEIVVEREKEAQRILGATEAHRLLNAAERAKKPDMVKLREAISKADQFGVEESAIGVCRHRLQHLEASEALSSALTKKDPTQLQEAICRAHEVGLADKAKIVKAEKALCLIQARDELYAAAETFSLSGGDPEALTLAIAHAKEAHVEKKDIAWAELKLKAVDGNAASVPRKGRRASC